MTNGRLLARNSVLNLVGQVGPLAVAFFAVPILVRGLGTDRFGVLQLAWAAIGYFSLFDFGLGRALTQAVSAAIGEKRDAELPELSYTALATMLVLGVVGGAVLALLTRVLVERTLHIPLAIQRESEIAFYLLSASLPFVLTSTGLRGLLEAHQDFGLATALRIPYAIFNFLAPLAILPFSKSLVPVVAVLAFGRFATWLAYLVVCVRRYPFLRARATVRRATVVPLLRQGGWMTVSNIISPLMVNLDRFLVGALLTITAVAYYATPYDMVIKLLLVPAAVLGVLFPAFAATFKSDRTATARLLDRAIRAMILSMFPAAMLLVTFAYDGLRLWLGTEFASHSAVVVQWLAAGVFINSIGQVPFAALQGIGRSDITAKLHALELPLYTVLIVTLTRAFGLPGVAMAWTLRLAVDTAALLWLSARELPELKLTLHPPLRLFGVLVAVLAVEGVLTQPVARVALCGASLVIFVALGWWRLLEPGERSVLVRWSGYSA